VTLRQLIRSDLDRFAETFALRGEPFSRTRVILESLTFKAGFQAVVLYRISHWLHEHGWPYLAWWFARVNLTLTGADIEYNAVIGPGMFISHPVGIVIGRGTCIGSGVTIFQGVTCGVRSWHPDSIRKFPTLGDRCHLFAHACVLGGVRVGSDCIVAAHTVVTHDMPDGSLARGNPAVIAPGAGRVALASWMETA
jgi:serine O-acetyltransferase